VKSREISPERHTFGVFLAFTIHRTRATQLRRRYLRTNVVVIPNLLNTRRRSRYRVRVTRHVIANYDIFFTSYDAKVKRTVFPLSRNCVTGPSLADSLSLSLSLSRERKGEYRVNISSSRSRRLVHPSVARANTHSVLLKELKKAFRFRADAIILPSLDSLTLRKTGLSSLSLSGWLTTDDRRVARDVPLARKPNDWRYCPERPANSMRAGDYRRGEPTNYTHVRSRSSCGDTSVVFLRVEASRRGRRG